MLFNNDWDDILKDEIHKEYFMTILYELRELYKTKDIFPPQKQIFNAFHLPYKDVKVVILGQDPYHGVGEAHGFAFSTLSSKLPPSLKNIYKELYDDLGIEKDYNNGDLTPWVKQGVMLLNTGLTVEKDKPNSHKNLGWHEFTDVVIQKLNEKNEPVVFILWGNNAREKKKFITKLSSIGTTLTLLLIKSNQCFAESIGTAEVQTATDNIKRVITSIAMPLGRCFNLC